MQPAGRWSAWGGISRPVWALVAATTVGLLGVAVYRLWDREPPMPVLVPVQPVPGLAEGNEAFRRREWTAAAEFYRIALQRDENIGIAWFRLGFSLHALRRFEEAAVAHRRAARYDQLRPVALYNLSCALALQNRREEALEALRAAIDANFQHTRPVLDDPDFHWLRDDEEFRVLAQLATRPPPSGGSYDVPRPPFDLELPADWMPPAELPAAEMIGR
jgi:tetratricopeptide (TPR) repeat protein